MTCYAKLEELDTRILVLGYGNIGSVIARDIAESMPSVEVVIAGRSRSRAEEIATTIDRDNVSWIQLDASNRHKLVDACDGFGLVVGALPGEVGYQSIKACIDAKVDMVDVSYMPEDPLMLSEDATRAGVTIIPDCGVAPGLSNILVGHAISKLDQVEVVHIMVGGLPEETVPPLGYVVTWSVEDLVEEYTREAEIVKDGKVIKVEALSGLEEVEFPGVGKLEAFYTDGLRTLLHTVKGVESMWEKTLRYPGHVEKIKLLKTLSFFDEEPVAVENTRVSPRRLTIKLLEKKLRRPEIKDVIIMSVEVSGVKKGLRNRCLYHLLDRYDEEHGVTAMARTTAYTASVIAQLAARKAIEEKGIIPPERLGVREPLFDEIIAQLKRRGIKVNKSWETLGATKNR